MAPVGGRKGGTGWVVIVQESYQAMIGRTLTDLQKSLWANGIWAMAIIAVLVDRTLGLRPPRH